MALRANGDQPTQNLFAWLSTWCGFTDWDHVFAALSRLKIHICRNENDIDVKITEILAPHFNTPENVRNKILNFIGNSTSDIAATSPYLLLDHLRPYLRTDRPTWTQYHHDTTGAKWTVAGLHGQNATDIEPIAAIVPALWAPPGRDRKLKIAAVCPEQMLHRSLSAALSRLALHLPNPGQALFNCVDGWQRETSIAVAGTLGLEDDGLHNLPWTEHTAPLNPSDVREINGALGDRAEASSLVAAMDEITWTKICEALANKINREIKDDILLGAVDSLWTSWKTVICQDAKMRSELLVKMLHPDAEGEDILGGLRVGPQTVRLLADGFFLLLIVAVGLGDNNATWENLGSAGKVRTIGLCRWGGPAGRSRSPCDLEDDCGVLLGKEVADVVILSGVKIPLTNAERPNLAETASDDDNFAKPRTPKLLVTHSKKLRNKLCDANLDSLRAYFAEELQRRVIVREENINRCSGGDIHAI